MAEEPRTLRARQAAEHHTAAAAAATAVAFATAAATTVATAPATALAQPATVAESPRRCVVEDGRARPSAGASGHCGTTSATPRRWQQGGACQTPPASSGWVQASCAQPLLGSRHRRRQLQTPTCLSNVILRAHCLLFAWSHSLVEPDAVPERDACVRGRPHGGRENVIQHGLALSYTGA